MSKKRRRNRVDGELGKLKKEMQSKFAQEGREVVFHGQVGEKMSDVIEEFIEPYRQYADTPDMYRRLIATGIVAWNAALLQGAKRETFLRDMLKTIAPNADRQAQEDFDAIVREMIVRKERYFANNRRIILNYRATETPTGMTLVVASSPE